MAILRATLLVPPKHFHVVSGVLRFEPYSSSARGQGRRISRRCAFPDSRPQGAGNVGVTNQTNEELQRKIYPKGWPLLFWFWVCLRSALGGVGNRTTVTANGHVYFVTVFSLHYSSPSFHTMRCLRLQIPPDLIQAPLGWFSGFLGTTHQRKCFWSYHWRKCHALLLVLSSTSSTWGLSFLGKMDLLPVERDKGPGTMILSWTAQSTSSL